MGMIARLVETVGLAEEIDLQLRRLRFVGSNQRFCVLPAGRRKNTASAVMGRTLRRLSADWVEAWGHPRFIWLDRSSTRPVAYVDTATFSDSTHRSGPHKAALFENRFALGTPAWPPWAPATRQAEDLGRQHTNRSFLLGGSAIIGP
jgi:hypothetical protein